VADAGALSDRLSPKAILMAGMAVLIAGNLVLAETGSFADCVELETLHQARCSQTEDHREAVAAFKEKRKGVFQGR